MEFSDGMDFEAWNATVRALSGAVDRLERTAALLAAPPWVEPLVAGLAELNGHLRRLEGAALPQCGTGTTREASADDLGASAEPDAIAEEMILAAPITGEDAATVAGDPSVAAPPKQPDRVPVRFGDPDAIACYGRRRYR